jgi:hypothetical protein
VVERKKSGEEESFVSRELWPNDLYMWLWGVAQRICSLEIAMT